MWTASLPIWEFVVRSILVYVFLISLLRITGKRQVGQLAPFDMVLLLVLSNSVQNAMNGGDNSVTGGMVSASTLIAANYLVAWMTYRSKRLAALVEGTPVILVHDGHVDQEAMEATKMTMHELHAALRAEGCTTADQVLVAVLENNGHITIIPRRKVEK